MTKETENTLDYLNTALLEIKVRELVDKMSHMFDEFLKNEEKEGKSIKFRAALQTNSLITYTGRLLALNSPLHPKLFDNYMEKLSHYYRLNLADNEQ